MRQTSIYRKNLLRLGIILIVVSILDVVFGLVFYRLILKTLSELNGPVQTPLGIYLKAVMGLTIGILSCVLYYRKKYSTWIVRIQVLLLCITFPVIILSSRGSPAKRVDGLINATLVLMSMVVYTALQLGRSERNWYQIRDTKPFILDLKLNNSRQWFNPIVIGPKLELNQEISSVVDRFLATSKELRPLEIIIHCPFNISEPMQATMQEIFQMYYEDEERRINLYLERRYIRAMALVVISITAVTIWFIFSPPNDEGVTWTILSNFAGFSLWQIGSTYFERAEGYAELLRAMISKQAKLYF